MAKNIYHRILFDWMKWEEKRTVPHREKSIICVAPHTSNWDYIIGQLYYKAINRKANYLMKKEWFFWPLGLLLKHLGGIPVNRGRNNKMTERLVEDINQAEHFELAITPEGTRSARKRWKRGFYYIALNAKLPIQLFGIDYEKKQIVCTKELIPCGDIDKDMKEIKEYYKQFHAKHPENFKY